MSFSLSSALNAFYDGTRRRSPSLKTQALRFTLAGGVAAVVDLAITWALQVWLELFDGTVSRTVGWAVGTLLAYLINRRWTFKAKASKRRFTATMLTYGMTYLANIAIYRALFPVLNETWNVNVALVGAFVVAQAVATVLNFAVQRWLIFRR